MTSIRLELKTYTETPVEVVDWVRSVFSASKVFQQILVFEDGVLLKETDDYIILPWNLQIQFLVAPKSTVDYTSKITFTYIA